MFNDKNPTRDPVTGETLTPTPFYVDDAGLHRRRARQPEPAHAESQPRLHHHRARYLLGQRVHHQFAARRERRGVHHRLDHLRQAVRLLSHGQLRDYLLHASSSAARTPRTSATTPTVSRRTISLPPKGTSVPGCSVADDFTQSVGRSGRGAHRRGAGFPREQQPDLSRGQRILAAARIEELDGSRTCDRAWRCRSRRRGSNRIVAALNRHVTCIAQIGSRKRPLRGPFSFSRDRKPVVDGLATQLPTQPHRGMSGAHEYREVSQGSRRMRVVKGLLLQAATTALVAACGGGGYGGGDGARLHRRPRPPAPAAVIRDAQFVDDTIEGLGFSVANVGEGRTDAAGKFQFAEGRKIDFFVGGATNRIAIGSATPDYTQRRRSRSACTISPRCRRPTASLSSQPAAPAGAARRQRRQQRRLPDRRRREHRDRHRRHRHATLDFAANAANFGNDAVVEGAGDREESHADRRRRGAGCATSCCSASRAPAASRSPATTRAPWS